MEATDAVARSSANRLPKTISGLQYLALAIACIAPFLGIFAIYGGAAAAVGTGVLYLLLLATPIILSNATVHAHICTLFPSAGGAYSVLRGSAGRFWGLVFLVIQLAWYVVGTVPI